MAEQVEELVVAAKAEGLEETSEGFEEMEADMDEVADGMEDTTGQLAELEQRFTGAMGAILVGIGALTAGLLTQIPVVGEVLAGLGSVVDAIAFRLDQRLRPALEPIADAFFKISEAVFELDGPLGKLFDTVLVGSVVFGLLAGAVGAASLAMTGLTAVVAGLSTPFLIVAGAIALLVGIIATDFLGIRSRLVTSIVVIANALKGVADTLGDIAGFISDIGGEFLEFTVNLMGNALLRVKEISNFVTDVLGGFFEFTVRLTGNALLRVKEIGNFVTNVLGELFEFTVNLGGNALKFVRKILNKLQKIVGRTWSSIVNIAMELITPFSDVDIGEESSILKLAGEDVGGATTIEGLMQQNQTQAQTSQTLPLFLDGRSLEELAGRYAQEELSRRSG